MAAFVWDADPELVRLGSFALRWYSLLFAGGFIAGHWLLQSMWRRENRELHELDTGLVYVIVATIVGARLAHCFFYDPAYYLAHPAEIFKVWTGGLASHGGFAAVFGALWLLAQRFRTISFLGLVDRVLFPVAMVAGMIRLGNLFNSEIIGRPTDLPWGVVFAKVDQLARHPSQIYEAIGYFACSVTLGFLYWRTDVKSRVGTMTGIGIVIACVVRFSVEFLKENQSSFEAAMPINMGQVLTIPFLLAGVALIANVQSRVPWLVQSREEREPKAEPVVRTRISAAGKKGGGKKGKRKKGAA